MHPRAPLRLARLKAKQAIKNSAGVAIPDLLDGVAVWNDVVSDYTAVVPFYRRPQNIAIF